MNVDGLRTDSVNQCYDMRKQRETLGYEYTTFSVIGTGGYTG